MEVNGVMGYDLDMFTSENIDSEFESLVMEWSKYFRWILVRIFIGTINVIKLEGINIIDLMLDILPNRIYSSYYCNDWEKLFEWNLM